MANDLRERYFRECSRRGIRPLSQAGRELLQQMLRAAVNRE